MSPPEALVDAPSEQPKTAAIAMRDPTFKALLIQPSFTTQASDGR
jgi:hypothetical protein